MDVLNAVEKRKSIRGFKTEAVSQAILHEILQVAFRSPTAMNTQPWELTVVTGEILDQMRQANIEKLNAGAAMTTEAPAEKYPDAYKQRAAILGAQIFKVMDIAREDKAKRNEWGQRGFRYFDAPAVILIATDKSLDGTWSLFDVGALSQSICTVALQYGLGTCIESQGIKFPEVIRKFTGIPDEKNIIISIAIGYPDWDFPANNIQTEREPVDKMVSWAGFPSS